MYQSRGSVIAKFSVSAGNSCDGFKLLHSLDSINFNEVYDYPGICGANNEDQHFSALHSNAARHQLNYYKIRLSTVETSEVKKIYVPDVSENNMLLYPNPLTGSTTDLTVQLGKADFTILTGYVSDGFGRILERVEIKLIGGTGLFSAQSLSSGIYLLRLTDNNTSYVEKFCVFR